MEVQQIMETKTLLLKMTDDNNNKPVLGIDKKYFENGGEGTLGAKWILDALVNTGIFNIEWHDERIRPMRGERATIFHYKNKRIYFDLWEYPTPSHTPKVVNANFDLIIKLQHQNVSFNAYNRYIMRKRLMPDITENQKREHFNKIVPWTFFPSRMILSNTNGFNDSVAIERMGFFCGKAWKTRIKTKNKLIASGVEVMDSSQESRAGRPLTDEDYIHKMRSSKYGVVIQGRGSMVTDVKNRREIDYMILRKPLLMSYKPFYYDPLIPGKHYIYFDENTDLSQLDIMYNVKEIEENAYQWYQRNATKKGMAETLLKIFEDKL